MDKLIGWIKIFFASLVNKRLGNSINTQSIIVAAILICVVFPDVIFLGASMRIIDKAGNWELRVFYPQPVHRQPWHSYIDAGGASFQSEPMMEFMLRTLREGDSPYWNPYSAAGSLGPESLVDNKFSAFTLLYVLLGGGVRIYNFLLLFLYFLAAYFTFRFLREIINVSLIAGMAATIFYLLNGYNIVNIGMNYSQSFLYIPLCVYASVLVLERPTALRIAGCVLAFAALISCTFLWTTITSMFGIYGILIGYSLMKVYAARKDRMLLLKVFLVHGCCLAAAVLLLSFIYFPILENIQGTGGYAAYLARPFYEAGWMQIVSLFTPSHYYESYNAIKQEVSILDPIYKNTVYHFGSIALCFIGCALNWRNKETLPLVIACLLTALIGLFRIFGLAGFSVINKIPIIGMITCAYWWPMVFMPAVVLVALGVENVYRRSFPVGMLLMPLMLLVSLYVVRQAYGFHEPNMVYKQISVILVIVLTIVSCLMIFATRLFHQENIRKYITAAITLLLLVELTMDGKIMRLALYDIFESPSPEILFIKEHIGLYRTMTIADYDRGLIPERGSAYGVQEISSINQGSISSYLEYFRNAFILDKEQGLVFDYYPGLRDVKDTPDMNSIDWGLINLLGVKYVILPEPYVNYQKAFVEKGLMPVFASSPVVVYENPNVLPRAFAVDLKKISGTDGYELTQTAISGLKKATVDEYRNAEIHLRGKVNIPSLIVLTDNWHKNWRAFVNDKEVPIVRVNGTFRGIRVPAGRYEISMYYRPHSLNVAIAFTAMISLFLIYMVADRKRFDEELFSKLPRVVEYN